NRRPNAVAAIAIHGRNVGPRDAVVLVPFVERLDAHGPDALRDQFTDWIHDHRGDDTRVEPKTISEIGRDIKLSAANMDLAFTRFAKGHDPRIEAVHDC